MIELKGLTKRFDDFLALDNIDLTIKKGTTLGLLGSNGAGKSTILRIISGIYKQESGTATIEGQPIFDNVDVKEQVFFINDETIQFSSFTLNELKNFYSGYYPNFSNEIFEKLTKSIKLPINKRIDAFSKGMKRQAIVIIGISCQTNYLIFDETFDGLDPTMRAIVKHMLVDAMLDRELTIIISSHNIKEINEICDTVALLHKGKVLFSRDLDSVKEDIHKVQVAFNKTYDKSDFCDLDLLQFECVGSITYLIVRGTEEMLRRKLAEKNPIVLDIIPLTLEEIFIYEMEGRGYDSKNID